MSAVVERGAKNPFVVGLSTEQISGIVEAATEQGSLAVLLSSFGELSDAAILSSPEFDPERMSQSLLRGLQVLAVLAREDAPLGNVEVSRALGMNGSTSHRYLSTLVTAGLVERPANSKRYLLASASSEASEARDPLAAGPLLVHA